MDKKFLTEEIIKNFIPIAPNQESIDMIKNIPRKDLIRKIIYKDAVDLFMLDCSEIPCM